MTGARIGLTLPPFDSRPRVLVILPKFQPYYIDRELYNLLPGYQVIYATSAPEMATRFHGPVNVLPVGFTGVPRLFGGHSGSLVKVQGLDGVLRRVAPSFVVTFEIFSRTTDQVARSPLKNAFTHVVSAYETSSPDRGLWGVFPWTRLLARRNAPLVNLVVAASHRAEVALRAVGVPPERIVLIRPGVRSGVFESISAGPKAAPGIVLYLGALRKNKGLITLIRALDGIWPDDERAGRLVIAGSGPLGHWVETQAATRSWIRFEGAVSESKKMELFAAATVFVYPSEDERLFGRTRWEEQGALAAVEAMMAGLPVVGTDCGALPEILAGSNDIVPQHSPSQLGRAIQRTLSDPDKRRTTSVQNRARARTTFDLQANARKLAIALAPLGGSRHVSGEPPGD